jgi:hypothetical protein
MHNKQKSLKEKINENIVKYNNKKCKWKKYTKKSLFFILISLIMLIIKKIDDPTFHDIHFGIFITIVNLFFSIIFHFEYCSHDFKFYIRWFDIFIAKFIFIVAIYFGNIYTYIVGIIGCIIYYIELYYDDEIYFNEVGMLHTIIHFIHPIMMYTVLFIKI